MTEIDFSARIERARRYFDRMRSALADSWNEAFLRYEGSDDALIDGLVLLNPAWIDTVAGLPDVRGPRTFGFPASGEHCQAALIWGYDCPGSDMEIDHMFPYGLGGPTSANNGLILCREHNRIKGHDVHLLPWETYTFPWLEGQIEKVRARLS